MGSVDFSTIPRLETPRLILRAHRVDDLDACAAMWTDPRVVKYMGGERTRAETWGRILRHVGMWAFLGYGFWAVEERSSATYLGELGFADALRAIEPPISGIPEAGWGLVPQVHGRGYASEALAAALAWIDATLAPPQTVAIIALENAPSLALAKKFDFHLARTIDFAGSAMGVLYRERGEMRAARANAL